MQKFTRDLTREVEIGGERLAVTFSAEGLALRPVGSRRPPLTLSWARLLCAALGQPDKVTEPDAQTVAQALQLLKKPPKEKPAAAAAAPSTPATESDLADLLARVDHWLRAHRPRIALALLPPATAEQLNSAEQQLGRPFPEELRSLLAWHNGQNAAIPGAFERCFFLMSAEQIVQAARDSASSPPDGWQPGWLPFLEDGSDSFVVLDPHQTGVPVRDVWRGQKEHPVVAPSLTAWVQGFLEGLEKGAYVEDPERGTFFRKESA